MKNPLAAALIVFWSAELCAHDLEDGFIERAVEVVVRNNTGTLNYYFGANPNTMGAILKQQPQSHYGSRDFSTDTLTTDWMQIEFATYLLERVGLENNGESVKLRLSSVVRSPKHHFDLVAKFHFELPEQTVCELSFLDNSFVEFNSAVRYAAKTAGTTMLLRCNVAPIIVRAQRLDQSNLPSEKQIERCKIEMMVAT